MGPFFSVIIPIYNVGNKLNQSIQSVLQQSISDWELILIDDGSTDEVTLTILSEYEQANEQVKLYRQNNRGVSAARNLGIKKSTGIYILFLDADDEIEKDLLKIYKEEMELSQERCTDVILCDYKTFFENKNLVKYSSFFRKSDQHSYQSKDELIYNIYKEGSFSLKGGCVRREVIIENALYFPVGISVGEDVSWTIKVLLCINSFLISHAIGYIYHIYKVRKLTYENYSSQVRVSRYWINYFNDLKWNIKLRREIQSLFAETFLAFSIALHDIGSLEEREKCIDLYAKYYKLGKFAKRPYYRVTVKLKKIAGAHFTINILSFMYKVIKKRSVLDWT